MKNKNKKWPNLLLKCCDLSNPQTKYFTVPTAFQYFLNVLFYSQVKNKYISQKDYMSVWKT